MKSSRTASGVLLPVLPLLFLLGCSSGGEDDHSGHAHEGEDGTSAQGGYEYPPGYAADQQDNGGYASAEQYE